jgi:hypothetical protein
MEDAANPRARDTSKARQARSAAATRRRHERYIEELAEYGITVKLPDSYTGLKPPQQN